MELAKDKVLILACLAALGSGVIGGLLFAFSNCVMPALSRQSPASGVRTMQAVNVSILNPLFFVLFFGTAVTAFVLAVVSISRLGRPGASWLLAGSALYLLGTVGVTAVFNVPLNNRLALLTPDAADTSTYWLTYLSEWIRWNHVRTIASVLSAVLFICAICNGSPSRNS